MNSWASDLSCTDSNYCWCCLLLTQVNRMSHENTRAQQKGSWIRGVPGWGPCGRCVGDTKDRAGQCLNVTTLLFAVNYGWGQEYWLCNPAEQTFCCSQWRWREKKKVQCLFLFCLFFSFLFLQSKIKSEISRQAQNSCQEKGDRKLKLRELRDKLNTKKQQQGVKTNSFQHLLFSICFAFPYMYDWLNLPTILLSGKYIYIYVKENNWYWPMQSISFTISNQSDPTCCMYTRDKRVRR